MNKGCAVQQNQNQQAHDLPKRRGGIPEKGKQALNHQQQRASGQPGGEQSKGNQLSCADCPEGEAQKVTEERGNCCTLNTNPGDQNQVQHNVGTGTPDGGPQGKLTLFHDHINAAHEGGKCGEQHCQRQRGNVLPGTVVPGGGQKTDLQTAQNDNYAACQNHGTHKGAPYLTVELNMYLPFSRGFLNGRKLPGFHENCGKERQNGGYLAGNCIQAVGVRSQKIGNHVAVRNAGDPPENGGGDQGNAVAQHGLPQRSVRLWQPQLPEPFPEDQKNGADAVCRNNGHDITQNAHPEHQQKENIESNDQCRVENALYRKQCGFSFRADVLGAQTVQTGSDGIGADQFRIFPKTGTFEQQRKEHGQNQGAQKNGIKPDGENTPPMLLPVQRKAENTVCNAQGYQRNQEIRRLHDQIRCTVIRGSQNTGIESDHQEGQKLRTEGPDTE